MNLGNQQLMLAIDFDSKEKNTMEVNGYRQVTNILQNTLYCAQQKKETHTGLEQVEGE